LNLGKFLIKGELFKGRADWDSEDVPALITELAAKRVHFSTFGTMDFQFIAAFAAKLGTLWTFELALWASHF
jgi:hypothetical protein